MSNSYTPFEVPLTFLNISEPQNALTASNFIERSRLNSSSSILVSWGLSQTHSETTASHTAGNTSIGSIVGLQDGSFLMFCRSESKDKRGAESLKATSAKSSPRLSPVPMSRASHPTSRSTSPSSTYMSPFAVNQRSRIVSGVTAEQVEAPKNYVDFDDEPERLKDMLKGRGPKERTSSELHPERPTADLKPVSPSAESSPMKRRKETSSSLLSSTNSPSFTPLSLSAPISPKTLTPSKKSVDLEIHSHIVPPRSGTRNSIVTIRLLDRADVVAVLQQCGDLSILSTNDGRCLASLRIDDTVLPFAEGARERNTVHDTWVWSHLQCYRSGERTLLLLSASLDENAQSLGISESQDENNQEQCRVVIVELRTSHLIGALEVKFECIAQWYCAGVPQAVGLHIADNSQVMFYNLNLEGEFIIRPLHVLSPLLPYPAPEKGSSEQVINIGPLPLPNLFKMKPRPTDQATHMRSVSTSIRIRLEAAHICGKISFEHQLLHFQTRSIGEVLLGFGWSEHELVAFTYAEGSCRSLFVHPAYLIRQAQWINSSTFVIAFEEKIELYTVTVVDANNDEVSHKKELESTNTQPKLLKMLFTGPYDAFEIISNNELMVFGGGGTQQINHYTWNESTEDKPTSRLLWRSTGETLNSPTALTLTSILVVGLETIILGYSDGHIRQTTLLKMCQGDFSASECIRVSDVALQGGVISLHLVKNDRTNERLIIGGGDDGSIAIWTTELKLCAQWIIFNVPIYDAIQFPGLKNEALRGCVLCVSEDGTIAVIAVDGFQFMYIIPGSPFPLQRVCLREDNLLLAYADHRVRLWDIKAKEFWRSTSLDKAEEIIAQGGWSEIPLDVQRPSDCALRPLVQNSQGVDTVSTLLLDVDRFMTESLTVIKSISTSKAQTRSILRARDHISSILSILLTPGLNQDIDEICFTQLGVQKPNASIGFARHNFTSLYQHLYPEHCWCVSGDVSAARALAIVAALRALGVFEELSESANTVINFYATSLSGHVGPLYKAPNLAFLARRWFDCSNELRHSVRLLFDAALVRLSDDVANMTIEEWQHQLPCLQPTADRDAALTALSLFLCGYLAAEKYSLISTSALTDISKSISMYLHDEQSIYRVLAIDLCARGFHVWQHYIDALEILRALFTLATSSRKDSISAQNVGSQARAAILNIASSNTPLFMTTLGLDILDPVSTEHRKSVMQIVAFLIRKRPHILQPNLPKLMEAVVKSLDPNATSNRDAVLDTATEIIGHVVQTFPTIDFHMASQRLAVGTNEGAIVMYDLKTAIRLYVLEGHKKRLTACSFSPDGRRLVTLSLEESVVLVWKVGTSFTSFFNPGAPPRQGHSGSAPFKTLSFNVGEEGNMSIADTLTFVRLEWTADRSVKLKIRDSTLTFST